MQKHGNQKPLEPSQRREEAIKQWIRVGRWKNNTLGLMVSRETGGAAEELDEGMEEGRSRTGGEDRKRDWEAARGRSSLRVLQAALLTNFRIVIPLFIVVEAVDVMQLRATYYFFGTNQFKDWRPVRRLWDLALPFRAHLTRLVFWLFECLLCPLTLVSFFSFFLSQISTPNGAH